MTLAVKHKTEIQKEKKMKIRNQKFVIKIGNYFVIVFLFSFLLFIVLRF